MLEVPNRKTLLFILTVLFLVLLKNAVLHRDTGEIYTLFTCCMLLLVGISI